MEWTRIPTGLLLDKIPERDLTAIIKYQLLWGHLEEKPSDDVALRHVTKDQLNRAKQYMDSISGMVIPDIRALVSKRRREKKNYNKNKQLKDFSTDGQTDVSSIVQSNETTIQIKDAEQNDSKKIINLNKNRFPPIPPIF